MQTKFLKVLWKCVLMAVMGVMIAPHASFARHGDDDDSSSSSSSSSVSSSRSSSSSRSRSSSSHSNGSSSSASSSSGGNSQRERIRVSLLPATGVNTEARGRAEYRRRSEEKPARFEVKVKVPLGSAVPAVADESAAAELVLTANVVRASVVVASCALEFDRISDDSSDGVVAEYKSEVRSKKRGRIQIKAGECVSAATSAVAVPSLKSGDTVQVETVADGVLLEKTVP